jgi:hypothetical protein
LQALKLRDFKDLTGANGCAQPVSPMLELVEAREALQRAEAEAAAVADIAQEERRLRLLAEDTLARHQSATSVLTEYLFMTTAANEVAAAEVYARDRLKSPVFETSPQSSGTVRPAHAAAPVTLSSDRASNLRSDDSNAELGSTISQHDVYSVPLVVVREELAGIALELQALSLDCRVTSEMAREERGRRQRRDVEATVKMVAARKAETALLADLAEVRQMIEVITVAVEADGAKMVKDELVQRRQDEQIADSSYEEILYSANAMAVERHVRICERLAGSLEFTIASAASRATTERLATERALVALWQSVSAIAADGDAMLRISAVEAAAQDSESRCCAAAAASAASVSYRRIEELQVRDACAGDLVRTHINEVVRFCP